MIIIDKLLKLTPRKLNIAMLVIAISSLSTIIVYLFNSNKDIENQRFLDCREDNEKSRETINLLKGINNDLNNQLITLKDNELKKAIERNIELEKLVNKSKRRDDILHKLGYEI